MSSWFSALPTNISDFSGNLKDFTDKVQAAIPIDAETIQKLTLNSPDMVAEREQYKQDADRKARLKNSLAHMYPWETRDEEREILVDECKQAIMALSHDDTNFFGPYLMPRLAVKTSGDKEQPTEEDEYLDEDTEQAQSEKSNQLQQDPSPESKEKLAKLEPLPSLLGNFDLDAHVGLIQKMLEVDPKLVERQSILSGGGEREKIFWRNYFFHCAFTRYEAGLSIDEIWSDQPPTVQPAPVPAGAPAAAAADETIVFEKDEAKQKAGPKSDNLTPAQAGAVVAAAGVAAPSDTPTEEQEQKSTLFQSPQQAAAADDAPASSSAGTSAEYEVVSYEDDNFGGELDELEAEIAEALGD